MHQILTLMRMGTFLDIQHPPRYLQRRISARVVKKGLNMKEFLWSLIHSPKHWVIAGVMAFIIWAIADLLQVGDSRIRGLGRCVTNKISEQSVARLKKRIEGLKKYKKNLDLMLNSDKALYLNTFRAIFGTLLFGCIEAILTTLRHSEILAVARSQRG
jgi:hypothetical protein